MKYKKILLINRKFKKNKKFGLRWYHNIILIIVFLIIVVQLILRLFPKNSFFMKNEPFEIMPFFPNWNRTNIVENYFSKIPKKFKPEVDHELYLIRLYMQLTKLSDDKSSPLDKEAKLKLYNKLGGTRYSQMKNIYIKDSWKFGNKMIMLNNIIFYIELLGEKKNLYLNSAHHWFMKDKIITEYVNISMANDSMIDCKSIDTYCIEKMPWLLTPQIIWPEIRLMVIKSELMKNLPIIKTKPKDLYIHIRSGDIFRSFFPHNSYSQPPLCFYKSIINTKKFREIYIITENDKSPIVKKLKEDYPQIILNFNSLEHDISALINAYNLVGSVSSFNNVCLILNENVKNYYEYDIYRNIEKFRHFHHDCYKYPRSFNIYQMKPSDYYRGEMYYWQYSGIQVKAMLEEKCEFSEFKLLKT